MSNDCFPNLSYDNIVIFQMWFFFSKTFGWSLGQSCMALNLCLFHPGKSLNESHGWNTLGSMRGFFSAIFPESIASLGGYHGIAGCLGRPGVSYNLLCLDQSPLKEMIAFRTGYMPLIQLFLFFSPSSFPSFSLPLWPRLTAIWRNVNKVV